ncbi:unnamed protein product [Cylindrotheca closterium]|uniref:Uncharacterized protein n=1 Tax=Cylindrotheca closterium TaxID=2856 RepID=A0AAD2CW49_9STRA|nr:unnamed protein product [Cylindrotheca closterium]
MVVGTSGLGPGRQSLRRACFPDMSTDLKTSMHVKVRVREGIGRDQSPNGGQGTVWEAIAQVLETTLGIESVEESARGLSREIAIMESTLSGKVDSLDYEDTMIPLEKALVCLVERIMTLETRFPLESPKAHQEHSSSRFHKFNQGEELDSIQGRVVKLESILQTMRDSGFGEGVERPCSREGS